MRANNSVERDVRKLRLRFPSPAAPAAPHVKRWAIKREGRMNLRSATIAGTLIGLLGFSPVHAQERPPARVPDQYGRFVITFSPFARADTFLLDTQTGKVWHLTKYTDVEGEPLIWKIMERVDSEAQLLQWFRSQSSKSNEKPPSARPQ